MAIDFTYRTSVAHGIKFKVGNTTKDTWTDWRIVPTSRPVVNPPEAAIDMVMIPGATEALDLSDAVSGYPTYGTRTGQWEFRVINKTLWAEVYSMIMNFLQGKSVQVILNDDPAYYYTGRCQVNQWQSDQEFSNIVIDYQLNPYKYFVQDSNEPWKWDPFSFIDGVIRSSYNNIEVEDEASLSIVGTDLPVSPKYVVSLTNTNPTITWSQGTITAGSDADSTVNVRTGSFTGRNVIIPGVGMQCAVAVYDSSDNYLGFLQSNGSTGADAYWSAGNIFTPVSDIKYRVIARYSGGTTDIIPSNASNSTSGVKIRACMSVRAGSGTTYPLYPGTNIVPDLVIRTGTTTLTFIGTGTVSVRYRGGKL